MTTDDKPAPRPGSIVRCGDGSTWRLIKRLPDPGKGAIQSWRADVVDPAGDKDHTFACYLEFDPGQVVVASTRPQRN